MTLQREQATGPYVLGADRKFEPTRKRPRQLAQWFLLDQEENWLDECQRYVVEQLRAPAFAPLFEGLTELAAERERWRRASAGLLGGWALPRARRSGRGW